MSQGFTLVSAKAHLLEAPPVDYKIGIIMAIRLHALDVEGCD